MRSRMTMMINFLIYIYLQSFIAYLYSDGHESNYVRNVIIIFTIFSGIHLTSIASREKIKLCYNKKYTIWVVIIILVMAATSMRYWVISLAIPPIAFYFFRVRNETRDVSLSDFRDLRKIALRIESSEAMNYIMDRVLILGLAYLVSNLLFIDDRVARYYVPMIIPILIHDIVIIFLYFQMEYAPEIEEGSTEETE